MELVVKPSVLLLLLPLGVLGVLVLSMLLKQGDWKRKGPALGIAVVVLGVVTGVLYRPVRLRVDEQGVSGRAMGAWQVPWSQLRTALYVEDLAGSPYRPGMKSSGVSLGAYRLGWFRLAGGGKARVVSEQNDRAVVLLLEQGEVVVLAPRHVEELRQAVRRHHDVQRWVAP